MQKNFHKELLLFLEAKACMQLNQRKRPAADYIPLADLLNKFEKKQDQKILEKIIESYYYLGNEIDPGSLELSLMRSFSSDELKKVKTIPKILRGLPRLFNKKDHSISKIHPFFLSLTNIRKKVLNKTLFYLYENVKIIEKVEVACLYEKEDERFFLKTLFKTLQKKLRSFEFSLISCVQNKNDDEAILITKEKKISIKSSTKSLLSYVRSVPLIFQLFHPAAYIDSFFEKTKKEDCPHYETIGGYGQIEEKAFFPDSSFSSLGLHFLEIGVLSLEKKDPTISSIPYYLCTNTSDKEAIFYTKLLLEIKKKEAHDIKIEYFSKTALDAVYEELFSSDDLQVQTLKVLTDKKVSKIKQISSSGKNLFLAFQSELSYAHKSELFASSQEPIGISSDIGFSYAVSYNKTYIYSMFNQSSCLLKDLIALAKNRLMAYPKAIVYLENLYQLQLHHYPQNDDEYVSEEYFQISYLDSLEDIQKRLSLLINTREVVTGLRLLNEVIYTKFSANSYITGLIKRAFLHKKYPALRTLEDAALARYLSGSSSFLEMIKSITSSIKQFV